MELAGRGMAGIFSGSRAGVHSVAGQGRHCMTGHSSARPCYALGMTWILERCKSLDQPGWLDLRLALWTDGSADDHRGYMTLALAQPDRFLQLMLYDEKRVPIGFIEGSIRADYVNGTETSPVGFVEGVYVYEPWRRKGAARMLYAAVGDWARARGCSELASDALLENEESQRAHRALGFKETERVVYFVKKL
jgi:aminoglycoside 6'-N-acetyltransferase I